MNTRLNLNKAALFIALLFHACGLAGILLTSYKGWFIKSTAINLLVMAGMLIITHPQKNKNFFLFFFTACITGFLAEAFGVNTAMVFGKYTYGPALGLQLLHVPLIIGINWFIIIYCTGMFTQAYENYMLRRLNTGGLSISKPLQMVSFMVDAVFLAVLFDWIMEPVATKLGYWQWQGGHVPFFNYISWIFLSALLLAVFKKLNMGNRNVFAVHLFMIQLLFFLVLRTFL
ncbi:carotenoid biosynthesis protein [Parafilimonas sp.]|uniref:carotenoid biosynthesis protein n=1 Tax=Parafilimonas sp. TaxID=1969739 RepID=UPI0039E24A4A